MNAQLANLKKVAIFFAAISTTSISAMAHADWSIIGLGSLGGHESYAKDINDSGQVVGDSFTPSGEYHAFITGPNDIGMTDLGTLGGRSSYATGINDSGQVVGNSSIEGNITQHAFIADPNNGIGMTDLGTLGGVFSRAFGINDSGQVVGDSGGHAFITGPNGIGMTDLGILGGDRSVATGINNSGQVIGNYNNGESHAFITGPNGKGMTSLSVEFSQAFDINDSGQVVGESITASKNLYAFITGPNGIGMTNLGTLGGGFSQAYGINDAGEVVGVATTATGESHSFIFSHGGMTDLSLLAPVVADGWTNIVVNSINNNGQMVGYGYIGHYQLAFLLSYTPDTVFTPSPIFIPPPSLIPEPETYLMLFGGLGLIGYLVRRREETAI